MAPVQEDPPPTASPPAGSPRGSRFPRPAAALGLYALLAVALTWPLPARLPDGLPAGDNDLWQNVWNFWWWKAALFERGQSPYRTDLLYQPGEVSLAFHTHSEANILTTLPVNLAAGASSALVLATILGFLLAAWGGYFLAREVAASPPAAFLGGIVLGFFPQHFEQSLEHLNLASYQGMPFFLFALIRLARRGGWRLSALAGATFALDCLYSWHNGLLVLPTAVAVFVREVARTRRPAGRAAAEGALAAGVAALILAPFLWPMAREILAGETDFVKPRVEKGIDPLFLFVPSAEHPFWGASFRGLYDRLRTYPAAGFTAYLGFGALALAVFAAVPSWKRRRADDREGISRATWIFWAALFAGNLALAAGDPLVLAGTRTGIRTPFALLGKIPVLETLRVANRFLVPAVLALSVLAAAGAREVLEGRPPRAKRVLFAALAALLALDYLWVPYPVRDVPRPAWTRAIERCPPGLLLDVPGSHKARAAEDMYAQTLHRRPTVGGYTSCLPPSVEERVRTLRFLELAFEPRPREEILERAEAAELLEADIREAIEKLGVAVIVLHLDRERERLEHLRAEHDPRGEARLHNPEKGLPARTLQAIRKALERVCGAPLYEDAQVAVYGAR
ncbi:MAG: hypothetical protein ACUVYA_14665 [Planctomycetota bacterium]